MTYWQYRHHPHIEARKAEGPVKTSKVIPRQSRYERFNARIGLGVTLAVGTMTCGYLFGLLALVSLPSAISTHSSLIIIAWIAQTFFQLILLPIIIVGQNIQAKAADLRSEQTYNDAEAVLHEAQQIQKHLLEQDVFLTRLVGQET